MSKKKSTPHLEKPALIHAAVVILNDVADFKNGSVIQTPLAATLVADGDARPATAIDAATAGVTLPLAAFTAAAKLLLSTPITKKET